MTKRARLVVGAYCAIVVAAAVAAGAAFLQSAGPLRPIGAYTTSLKGRTDDQVYNARLAARAIDGAVILPGKTFSFNDRVGSWSVDTGYRRAPVSYSGELVRDWGGGVCQTSTTLYNAALLAGMSIVERHRHHWPTSYVEPGRDAAVAFRSVDLRFANPYPWPVRLAADVRGDRLVVRLVAQHTPPVRYRVIASVRAARPPSRVMWLDADIPPGRVRTLVRGASGYDVEVVRVGVAGEGEPCREVISRDVYPVLHEVVGVGVRPEGNATGAR